jgi:hypothetical protein
MFKIEGNSVDIKFKKELTERQRIKLKHLNKADGLSYILSLAGIKAKNIPNIKDKQLGQASDCLANKSNNSIRKMFESLLNNGPNTVHAPTDSSFGEWIGVEIEFLIPKKCLDENEDGDPVYNSASDARNAIRSAIKLANITRCSVKDDGSVSDEDGHSCEVTLLYNAANGHDQLIKLCRVLSGHNCYVNATCGLHIHLDSRGLHPKTVRKNGRSLAAALPILKYMVPTSRRDNTYAKLGMSKFKGNRYYAINLTAFKKYGTIEVRLHSGTINSTKIINWIELISLISKSGIKKSVNTFQELLDSVKIPDKLVEYMERRITEFNPEVLSPTIAETCTISLPALPMPSIPESTIPSQNEAA